jgi:hypothetical protein
MTSFPSFRSSRQYFFQLEMASPSMLGRSGPDFFEQNTQTVEETYELRGEKTCGR